MKLKPFMRERNYLLLMLGALVNGFGGGIYLVAAMLLVLELTDSVLYSGFAVFAISLAGASGFLIAPLANYFKYKNSLVYSNFIKAILLFTIPVLHYTVGLNVWYVISLLFIMSLFSQYTYPIESTVLPIIVGKEHVVEANSYLQTIREALDIAFLAGAGIIITLIGVVPALTITATCLVIVSIAYTFFNFKQPEQTSTPVKRNTSVFKKYGEDLKGGFTYIKGSLVPKLIISVAFNNVAMVIMSTNMPTFTLAKGNGVEATYGFYLAAMSIGIMLGTMLAPKLKHFDFGKLIIVTRILTGLMWIGTALLPVVPSILLYGLGAISMGIFNILVFSTIQKQVDVAYIGRVITILTSTAAVGMPIGALLGGFIGERFDASISVIICGVAMICFSLYWLSSSVLRKLPSIDHVKLFNTREAELTETSAS